MLDHIAPQVIIDGTLYTLLIFSVLTWTLILFKLWQFGKNSLALCEIEWVIEF